jgi:hypothetical protein
MEVLSVETLAWSGNCLIYPLEICGLDTAVLDILRKNIHLIESKVWAVLLITVHRKEDRKKEKKKKKKK